MSGETQTQTPEGTKYDANAFSAVGAVGLIFTWMAFAALNVSFTETLLGLGIISGILSCLIAVGGNGTALSMTLSRRAMQAMIVLMMTALIVTLGAMVI